MKAYILDQPGIDVPMKLIETNIPEPKADEVLLKNKSFTINPVDVKTRNGGKFYEGLKQHGEIILGWDISGEVIKKGENVTKFDIGDEVFGMVNFPGHGKVYAEYVAAPAGHLTKKPDNISHEQAAVSTLAALTAYQIFQRYVNNGDKVFIQSAAGGVGHFGVQIAKIMGAYTAGTASVKNEDFLNEIGLDQFIDYKSTEFDKVLSDYDFALDTMEGETLIKTVGIIKDGGTIISLPSGTKAEAKALAEPRNIHVDFELVVSSGKDMDQIAEWLAEGKLVPHISHVFSFDQLEEAHQQILSGSTRGKVVLNV